MTNVEYIKQDYQKTLKSYKKSARSPAPALPTCVYTCTCIHVVNYTVNGYINDNTWSRPCAPNPFCSSCDFYVNWKDFSVLGKQ